MPFKSGIPLDAGTFIWVVVGTVIVFFVAVLTLRRAWVSFQVWPLQRRPFGRARGWVQPVSEPIPLETARAGNPHFTRKLPLNLSPGQSAVLIQLSANTRVEIHAVNLRCTAGDGVKPTVLLLSDQDPRGANFEWTTDNAGGMDLFYTSPRAVNKGRSVSYGAFIDSPEPWSGTLGLSFDVSPGNGMDIGFPMVVSGPDDQVQQPGPPDAEADDSDVV
jgi:hypothetical protein